MENSRIDEDLWTIFKKTEIEAEFEITLGDIELVHFSSRSGAGAETLGVGGTTHWRYIVQTKQGGFVTIEYCHDGVCDPPLFAERSTDLYSAARLLKKDNKMFDGMGSEAFSGAVAVFAKRSKQGGIFYDVAVRANPKAFGRWDK